MPKPNACVMAMVDAMMDRGSMLCEGGVTVHGDGKRGKGSEERGGESGGKSNGAQFHGW